MMEVKYMQEYTKPKIKISYVVAAGHALCVPIE